MRTAFKKTLIEILEKDKDVFVLTGDVGFLLFEEIQKRFPERFLNAGIAEQNMIGMAAGLALSGKKPFVYSIIPFTTMRCFEQLRNDVCYQNLNVKVIGVGAGFSYGSAGMTHQSIEDIAIMRALPGMSVVCPGDPIEAEKALRCAYEMKSPVYIRMGKQGEPKLHQENVKFKIGEAIVMREGKDATLIATGNMLESCLKVSDKLVLEGIGTRVLSMHTVKPLDKFQIIESAEKTGCIFTVEEHNIIGGLGSAVAEALAESNIKKPYFERIGISDEYVKVAGSQGYLRTKLGLDEDTIYRAVKNTIQRKAI